MITPAKAWPLAIVAVLAITVGTNVALLVAAHGPDRAVPERDYYRKGLAHDSTLAQRARDAVLGWTAAAGLASVPGGARVELRLADSGGAPLAGARVELEALHNRDAGHPVSGVLADAGDGRYLATLPMAHRGRWELRVDARRGADRFTAIVHAERP
jgi:nitrogen fixation protein FixH